MKLYRAFKDHIAVKSIVGIILLFIVFSLLISFVGHESFYDALLEQYSNEGAITARAGAKIVNADRVSAFVESGGTTAEYRYVLYQLDELCNSSGSSFVYVILPDRTDYAHITFLFSTKDHSADYPLFDFGYVRETTNEEYMTKYRAICEGGSQKEVVVRDKGIISTDPHITVMVPLTGSDHEVKGILCVQKQMSALAEVRRNYYFRVFFISTILVIMMILGQGVYLNNTLLRPIKRVTAEATRFSEENTVSKEKLGDKLKRTDEIGKLAGSIDHMEEQIHDYVQNLMKVTAENERIGAELNVATQIQADMLPNVFPAFPDRNEFDIHATMVPAKEVGGDFYDFFLIDQDHLALVMADVSGKGVPAALFMVIAKTLIKSVALQGQFTPAEVLSQVNNQLIEGNEASLFVTVWFCIVELSTGNCISANAGHEHPVIRRAGGDFAPDTYPHDPPLAIVDGLPFREHEFSLNPGDSLFVYTDGIPEATNSADEQYEESRMLKALNENPDAGPREILEAVHRSVKAYVGGAPQFDDMTMLCIKLKER